MRSPDVRLLQGGQPSAPNVLNQPDAPVSIGIASCTEMSPALNASMYEAWQSARVTDTDTLAGQKEQFQRVVAGLRADANEATAKKLDLAGPILEWATFCEPRTQLPEGLTYEDEYGWLQLKPVSVEVEWAIGDVQAMFGATAIDDLWARRKQRGGESREALAPMVGELVRNLPETRTLAAILAPEIRPSCTEQQPLSSYWHSIYASREECAIRQAYGVVGDLRPYPGAAREYTQRTNRLDNETMPVSATAQEPQLTDSRDKLRAFLMAKFDSARSLMGGYGPPPILDVVNRNDQFYFVHADEKSGKRYEARAPSVMQDLGVLVGNALGINRTLKEATVRHACNRAGQDLARCLFSDPNDTNAEQLLKIWQEEASRALMYEGERDIYNGRECNLLFDQVSLLQLGNMPHGPVRSRNTHYDPGESLVAVSPPRFLDIARRLEQKTKIVAEVSYVRPQKPTDTPRMMRRDSDSPKIPPLYPDDLAEVALYLQARKDHIFVIDGYRLLGKDGRGRLAYAYDDGHDPCLEPAANTPGSVLKADVASRACGSVELPEIAAALDGRSHVSITELNKLIQLAGVFYNPVTSEEAEYLTEMAMAGKFAALKDKKGALRLQCSLAQLPMYWLLSARGYDVALVDGYALPDSDGAVGGDDEHRQLSVMLDGSLYRFDATPASPNRLADEYHGPVSMRRRVGSFVRRAMQDRAARERYKELAAQQQHMERQLATLMTRGTTLDHVPKPEMPDYQKIIEHGDTVLPKLLRQFEGQLSQAYGVPNARALYSLLGKTIPRHQRLTHPVWQGLAMVRTAIDKGTVSPQDVLAKITYVKHCIQSPADLANRTWFDPVPVQHLHIVCDTLQIVAEQLAKQENVRKVPGIAVTLERDGIPERAG